MGLKEICTFILDELTDENKTSDDKMIFFMDNFDKIMKAMKDIKDNRKHMSDSDKSFYDSFIEVINNIRNVMSVDENTNKEDIIVSKETIKESLETNTKVQNLQKDLQDTIKAEYTPVDKYYIEFYSGNACVGSYTMENTKDKLQEYIDQEIADNINNIVITDVKIYKLTPVPVTVNTVTKVTIN